MGMSARSDCGIEVSMAGQAKLFAILLQDEHVGESVAVMTRLAVFLPDRIVLELCIESRLGLLMTRVTGLLRGNR